MRPSFDSFLFRLLICYILCGSYRNLLLNLLFFGQRIQIYLTFGSFYLHNKEERRLPIIILVGNDWWDKRGSFVVVLEVSPSLITWRISITHVRILLFHFPYLILKELACNWISDVIVCSLVGCQIWALREPFVAVWKAALVWFFSCVCSNMCF